MPLLIYPKPFYDTSIVKEPECDNGNDKRQCQKQNQHNQCRQQGHLECHHDTAWADFYKSPYQCHAKHSSSQRTDNPGQQQRVAIARALVSKPAIVLADEPTGNLDSKTSADVLGLLKTTSQKFHQTLVMITHNSEIAQLADRIIRIEDGKIVQ